MKRTIVAVASVIALIAFSVTMGGAAWSAANSSSTAVITFDDANQQAVLQIPTPACAPSQPDCQWKFFMNEPKLNVDVATVFGTSGTLTIAYPKDFCGVIQADAYVGPPFEPKRGFQHTISDCNPPPTTTTTTTTTAPPATTTTTMAPPPVAATPTPPSPPASPAPAPPPTSALPATAPAPAPVPPATPASTPLASPPAQLPFTGRDIKPPLFIGLALVVVGLCLLAPGESWRRIRRRLSAVLPAPSLSDFRLENLRSMAEMHRRDIVSTLVCTTLYATGTVRGVWQAVNGSNLRLAGLPPVDRRAGRRSAGHRRP